MQAIPHGVWLGLSVLEILCSVALILPAFNKRLTRLAPIAAAAIALEMLSFTGLHLASGDPDKGPIIYWLVVAVFCAVIALGRLRKGHP